jgi:hypothetical protein
MRILLAIPLVACTQSIARPLCDGDGRPACGNIGQAGQPAQRARSLLAAGVNEGATVSRPLLDARGRPAPGNCTGKCGGDDNMFEPRRQMTARGGTRATPAYLAGSRIAAVGERALVVDEDSGNLILTDGKDRNVAYLPIGRSPGMLVYEPASALAYVADRSGHRVVVVRVGEASLDEVAQWPTPVEPYGVALTPDRGTLLVTAIADRALIAFDTNGRERWRTTTRPEPRGIAISPDGKRAIVASLASGGVERVDLKTHAIAHTEIALEGNDPRRPSFARVAFAAAVVGNDLAVVPYQNETPRPEDLKHAASNYGGGGGPIAPMLALLDDIGQTQAGISTHLPRALAWDGRSQTLFVAGMGTDHVQEIRAVGTDKAHAGHRISMTAHTESRCGPDGIAVTEQQRVLVWCAFTRRVARITLGDKARLDLGVQLVPSALEPAQHAGLVAFHASDAQLSARGGLACASCHPEGRSDNLTWAVDQQLRQTPLLAGRIAGTGPFKWDGGDASLHGSIAMTAKHLGGTGAVQPTIDHLTAYLEALPAIATPRRDAERVARGKRVFGERGCNVCHDGPHYTDRKRHEFAGGLPSDTPSLRGLAASAPYYHDGSAPTLEAVLRGGGTVHMSDARMTEREVGDLVAYLETL